MDRKISMINRLNFSVNPKKYVDLHKEKLSKAFIYILLLAVTIGFVEGIMMTTVISKAEKSVKVALSESDLKFEMNNGILNFKNSPLKKEAGQVLLLIDTNKSIDDLDSLRNITVHKEIVTVLLSDGAMIKEGSNEVSYKYSDLGLANFNIDSDFIIDMFNNVGIIKYLVIPAIIIFKFIEIIIYALIISLIGILSNLISNRKMSYGRVLNLSLYAITLPTLISIICPLGRYTVIIGGIIIILGLTFITFSEIKKEENII